MYTLHVKVNFYFYKGVEHFNIKSRSRSCLLDFKRE